MKITDVQARVLSIPMKRSEVEDPWVWGKFSQVLVVVQTDEGITGYGESFGYGVPTATASVVNEVVRPMLIGEDPSRISALQQRMFRETHLFGRYGITTFAISGVDIALWDIAGKAAGLPLYRLLGGAGGGVPAYASLVRYPRPEDARRAAQRAWKAGYKAVKLHQLDLKSLSLTREAIGEQYPLMVDVNCAWDPVEASEMARQFRPYHLRWLEEPVWPPEDFQGLASLQRSSGISLAAGENACTVHQFRAMLDAGAVTYVQPSVTKVGGITEWLRVAALAEAYNVALAPHSPYHGPGFLATAHLIAATSRPTLLEHLYITMEESIFQMPFRIADGILSLPDGPGLGYEINAQALTKFAVG